VLTGLTVLDAVEPGFAFAEHLGQWVDFKHAIALSAVHNMPAPEAGPVQQPEVKASVQEEFTRRRSALEKSLASASAPSVGRSRIKLPTPLPGTPAQEARLYTPYRRYHQAQQRELDVQVTTLRAWVRDAVSKASPQLGQLVALDGTFDAILREREATLLAAIPALLEKRFNDLLAAHEQTVANTLQNDDPDLWTKPGGWLIRFCNELQTVLMAELDLRLLPSVGLLEAFNHELTQQQ
jgi:hypothetical protein